MASINKPIYDKDLNYKYSVDVYLKDKIGYYYDVSMFSDCYYLHNFNNINIFKRRLLSYSEFQKDRICNYRISNNKYIKDLCSQRKLSDYNYVE